MIKVSVIIPVYNVEDYLERCLDSVINQTFEDIEIICVNDCSTDNCLHILEDYAKKDNRIKIINREKNGGLSATRNSGLDVACGEYIYFLDSDDYIDNDYIEKFIQIANIHDYEIFLNTNVLSEFEKESQKTKIYANEFGLAKANGESLNSIEAINKTICMTWAHLFKKSFLDKNKLRFPENYIHEDVYFQYITHIYAKNIIAFNGASYHYFQRQNSIKGIEKDEDFEMFKIYNLIFDYFKINNVLNLYELKMFNTSLKTTINSIEKYEFCKSYFNKIKKHLEVKRYLYNPMDIYFADNIINSFSYEDYVKKHGKNLAIDYLRYQKKSKKDEFEKIQKMRKDLEVSIENAAGIIERNPYLYENTNENLLQFVYESILEKGDNAIDIGAHAGRHLSEIVRLVDSGKVLAFEPIPKMASFLKERFSKKLNIEIINKALSDKKGTMDFYIYNNSLEESGLAKREDRMSNKGDCEVIKIEVDILDSYIDYFNSIKFIKMDAESAELNILIGAKKIINKFRPIISIEFGADVKYFGHTKADLWNYLNDNNYYLADVWGNCFTNIAIWNTYSATCDFILIPKEKYQKFSLNLKEAEKKVYTRI